MTVKPFFLVVTSDEHQSYESMRIVATATKDTDAQKLYSKALKENFDDVTSILVINNFAPSKLSIEEQSDITERALENYDEFDYIIANDDLAKTKEKVFKILEELE